MLNIATKKKINRTLGFRLTDRSMRRSTWRFQIARHSTENSPPSISSHLIRLLYLKSQNVWTTKFKFIVGSRCSGDHLWIKKNHSCPWARTNQYSQYEIAPVIGDERYSFKTKNTIDCGVTIRYFGYFFSTRTSCTTFGRSIFVTSSIVSWIICDVQNENIQCSFLLCNHADVVDHDQEVINFDRHRRRICTAMEICVLTETVRIARTNFWAVSTEIRQ